MINDSVPESDGETISPVTQGRRTERRLRRFRASRASQQQAAYQGSAQTYADAEIGMIITVDRGRYRVLIADRDVSATKARQLGRTGVIVGDQVRVVGDTSGAGGTLGAHRRGRGAQHRAAAYGR